MVTYRKEIFLIKYTVDIPLERDGLWLDSNLTYTQVPGWLGKTTRDLKLSIIRHFAKAGSKRFPVILWFAGGGWMDTDHNM